eukprot:m.28591 g.28591  ORF g.28591 m.28591 type:complete len:128 (+) comp11859_c0_seq1:162-545(+)
MLVVIDTNTTKHIPGATYAAACKVSSLGQLCLYGDGVGVAWDEDGAYRAESHLTCADDLRSTISTKGNVVMKSPDGCSDARFSLIEFNPITSAATLRMVGSSKGSMPLTIRLCNVTFVYTSPRPPTK